MKTFTSVVFMVTTLLINPTPAHAMFGHVAAERERRQQVEQQISQERQQLDVQQHLAIEQQHRWQTTAFILGILAVFMLIAGTAIGSRGRHHAARRK